MVIRHFKFPILMKYCYKFQIRMYCESFFDLKTPFDCLFKIDLSFGNVIELV